MEKKNINEVIAELSVEQLMRLLLKNFVRKPVSISLRWWPSIRQKWKPV